MILRRQVQLIQEVITSLWLRNSCSTLSCRAFVRGVSLCLVISALIGCSSVESIQSIKPIKPWVKPYQRDKLADPLMVQDSFPLDTGYMIHMYRSREGGRGAEGAGGGGCGCN